MLYDQVHLPVSRQGYCDLKHIEKKFQAGSLPWAYVTRLSTVEVVVSGAGWLWVINHKWYRTLVQCTDFLHWVPRGSRWPGLQTRNENIPSCPLTAPLVCPWFSFLNHVHTGCLRQKKTLNWGFIWALLLSRLLEKSQVRTMHPDCLPHWVNGEKCILIDSPFANCITITLGLL